MIPGLESSESGVDCALPPAVPKRTGRRDPERFIRAAQRREYIRAHMTWMPQATMARHLGISANWVSKIVADLRA